MTKVSHRLFVAKERHKFAAAHMTVFPDGTKERLHGHNYTVSATLDLAEVSIDKFVDFGVVKRVLDGWCKHLDEKLLLARDCPALHLVRQDAETEFVLAGKRYVVPTDEVVLLAIDNVTTETLAEASVRALVAGLDGNVPAGVVLAVEVSVSESPGQGASCRMELDG